MLADLEGAHVLGHLLHRKLVDEVLAALAVGLGGLQMDVHGLADLHVAHSLVEALDHLACHAGELKRLVPVIGGVELRSVIKRAGVVDADLLAFIAHVGISNPSPVNTWV